MYSRSTHISTSSITCTISSLKNGSVIVYVKLNIVANNIGEAETIREAANDVPSQVNSTLQTIENDTIGVENFKANGEYVRIFCGV